jgi:ABC-type antimicrobial peptide transport system permease subunit
MSQNRRDKRKLEKNKSNNEIEITKKYKALKVFFIVAIVIFVLLLFILVLYSNMYINDHTH